MRVALTLIAFTAVAADYPTPQEGDWVARDFRFHTGEVMQELRLHYTTVGAPSGQPVLILHGPTQSGTAMLSPVFAGELFGPGQPLDASKYYVILPDSIGHGKSAKPSDGLRSKFPLYNYDDMVAAQYRLVSARIGLRHLRLVLCFAIVFYGLATNGGRLAYQKLAPTRAAADKLLVDRLAAPFTADANDVLYQWDSSRDYNPAPGLDRIQAAVLAINSSDDERNPPESGIMERELKRVKNGRLFLIPGSEDTSGHSTVYFAKFWKQQVQELLQTAPK